MNILFDIKIEPTELKNYTLNTAQNICILNYKT